MSRGVVISVFGCVLVAMLAVTTWASLDRSVFDVGPQLLTDRWFHATLADAYCGFITFFTWLAWRERTWRARAVWFVAIMLLGNIAMSIYVLWIVFRMKHDFSPERLLLGDRVRRAALENLP